ncbi:MAG: 2-oxo acid dehydrogenase subunit E2 [Myxococcota bacterium]
MREVHRGRAGATSGGDRFLRAFLRLPWPVGSLLMRFARALDHCNLLPASWVLAHPLHASAFVANLGSVGIPSAYHPLYEHGAIPLALVVGELRKSCPGNSEKPTATSDRCTLKYSYDGRIAEAAECARFAARVKVLLETPELLAPDDTPIAAETRLQFPSTSPEVPCHKTDDASF